MSRQVQWLGQVQLGQTTTPAPQTNWNLAWGMIGIAGAALAAYHGYKRNNESVGAAVGWGILGGLVPVITVPVALAQGYGEPKRDLEENPHRAEMHQGPGGTFVEVGTIEHEGKEYSAGGSFYDGVILSGYPKKTSEGWVLQSWGGTPITRLEHTGSWKSRNRRGRLVAMHSFRAVYDGKVFTGRNSGESMYLAMRKR